MSRPPDDLRVYVVPFETRSPVTDLVYHIMHALESDGEWHGLFTATDMYGVSAARSAGRAAGRNLGLRVYTSAQERPDHSIVVSVYARRDVAPVDDTHNAAAEHD